MVIYLVAQTIANIVAYYAYVWISDGTGPKEYAQLIAGLIISTPPLSAIFKWFMKIMQKKKVR